MHVPLGGGPKADQVSWKDVSQLPGSTLEYSQRSWRKCLGVLSSENVKTSNQTLMEISVEHLHFEIIWFLKKLRHHVHRCLQSAGFNLRGDSGLVEANLLENDVLIIDSEIC